MWQLHLPVSVIPVWQAGIVCLGLCTCVLQVCGCPFNYMQIFINYQANICKNRNKDAWKMHLFSLNLFILCIYAFHCVCTVACRLLLSWRNWIWLERLSRGHLWPWPWLLVYLSVQAVWRRPLLLFQKWHSCHWTMSGRLLLLTWKHLTTTSLTGCR